MRTNVCSATPGSASFTSSSLAFVAVALFVASLFACGERGGAIDRANPGIEGTGAGNTSEEGGTASHDGGPKTDADTALATMGNGVWGEYFNDGELTELALRRADDAIDFSWGNTSPHPKVTAPEFSARWIGQIQAPRTGTYTLNVEAVGGVRLWIGGDTILDEWGATASTTRSGTAHLLAGERYGFRLEYKAIAGKAGAHLRWAGPELTERVVSRESLFFTQLEPSNLVYATTGHRYAYAPSVVRDGSVEHVYFCHNRDADVIRDYVLHIKRINGQTVAQDVAIGPSATGWDSKHVCDPSVVESKVTWSGKSYRYVMFFLGTEEDNTHNQVGLALADSLDGPWTKYPKPLITYPYPYPVPVAQQCWGVGQPTATTVNDHGHVLLFYTQGGCDRTWARRSEIDIGNLDAPTVKAPTDLPVKGLLKGNGAQDIINSFDIAYDPSRDRFYIVRERHEVPGAPDDLEVDSIAGEAIWTGVGTWRFEAALTPDLVGAHKVHNAGLERDVWGMLADTNTPRAYVTAACDCGFPSILWSYWDHSIRMSLR